MVGEAPMSEGPANRVLLVDDDPEICDFLAILIGLEGMTPMVVTRPEDALEACASDGVVAILMDIAMPGLDGLELCRRIRATGNKVPILIVSARPGIDIPRKAAQAGANEFIRKPFENAELISRLSYWIAAR